VKRLLLGLCLLALPLGACTTTTPVSLQPATYTNQIVEDEQLATTAELAYKSWRLAATVAVESGLIKGPTAVRVAGIDNRLYAALTMVEHAYAAGNATSIKTALAEFNVTLNESYTVIGGK
jgi:hypothetical protein